MRAASQRFFPQEADSQRIWVMKLVLNSSTAAAWLPKRCVREGDHWTEHDRHHNSMPELNARSRYSRFPVAKRDGTARPESSISGSVALGTR